MTTGVEVFVVRHGETEWALNGRHTGSSDIALTPRGEAQALALATIAGLGSFTKVFTSPSRRARRTCELAKWSATAEIDPDLAEWDYGDYEGLTSAEVRRDRPGWSVWRDGCPRGESPDRVGARADRLVARLRASEGRFALFSHGQFGRVLAMRWVGWAVGEGRHLLLGPAHLGVLGYEAGDGDVPAIERWNVAPPA